MHSLLRNNGYSQISSRPVSGFTLMEMLATITIFFLMMVTILGVYRQMVSIKSDTTAKQHLIQQAYTTMEQLPITIKDFSIDYEEYFNRRIVGCNSFSLDGERDVGTGGICKRFTTYGNGNDISVSLRDDIDSSNHLLYYCSSFLTYNEGLDNHSSVVFGNTEATNNLRSGFGCYSDDLNRFEGPFWQSYGQYALQSIDIQQQTDTQKNTSVGDDDDENIGIGPIAIGDPEHIQELYLIGPSKQERIYIRRNLIRSGDRNGDGIIGNANTDNLYSIQILKLKGFDAGSAHSFDIASTGLYDGHIDTRACDSDEGFFCKGTSLGGIYSSYRMPSDIQDGRVNLTSPTITISDWAIEISPHRDPNIAWKMNNTQISPSIYIRMKTQLYGEYRRILRPSTLDNYHITLQTLLTTKEYYGKDN